MTSECDFREELSVLVNLYVTDMASDEQIDRLEHLLDRSAEARAFYLDSVNVHAGLAWRGLERQEELEAEHEHFLSLLTEESLSTAVSPAIHSTYAFKEEPVPVGEDLAMARWWMTVRVVATVYAVGLLASLLFSLLYPVPPAQGPGPVSRTLVGEITNMNDCHWGDAEQRVSLFDRIVIGQKFDLHSGMLEITYDTGFTVILQGPAKYEITSNHGGFLSTGRLTGRANAERARGFVVDMPGASVTDLGTEFGAEVRPDGTVETVVFSGSVRLVPTTPQGNVGIGQILREGQAAQVCLAAGSAGSGNANSEGLPSWALSKAEVVPASNSERFARSMPAIPSQVLLDATQFNGSFESPAIGPDNCDDEASDPTNKVYTKTRNAVPQAWNRTFALRTKGTSVQGVTGEQYVVLQGATSTLSTQFNGKPGHPPARKYEPHTVYVLTADVGGDVRGLKARVALNAGNDPICQAVAVSVSERDALEPIPTLALNTDAHPEFIGKPISISFVKTEASPVSQLYIDNVVLRAFPSKP